VLCGNKTFVQAGGLFDLSLHGAPVSSSDGLRAFSGLVIFSTFMADVWSQSIA
jgi:hypothetical protein